MLKNNILELGKQISDLRQGYREKFSNNPDPPTGTKNSIHHQSEVELDPEKPAYAASMYGNADYTPSNHIKFGMPRFDGSEPELWIFMARRFFIFHNTPKDQKLIIASFNMQGVALKWFLWMESSNYLSTWPAFVQSLLKKFNPTTYTIPGGKLSKLVQTSTVADFVEKFEDYSSKVVGVPDWLLLEMFISGLKDEIQKEVVRAKLDDIQEAMELAVHLEKQGTGGANFKGTSYKPFQSRSYFSKTGGDNTLNSSALGTALAITTLNNPAQWGTSPNFRRLSSAERKEKTSKGLCFNCDDKFSPSHKCKGKLFRFSAEDNTFWEFEDEKNN